MKAKAPPPSSMYTLDELSKISRVPRRTIRRYIHAKLVRRGNGNTRNTRYDTDHLQQVLRVKVLADQGLALKEIVAALGTNEGDSGRFVDLIGDRLDVSVIQIGRGVVVGFLIRGILTASQERRLLALMRNAYHEVVASEET